MCGVHFASELMKMADLEGMNFCFHLVRMGGLKIFDRDMNHSGGSLLRPTVLAQGRNNMLNALLLWYVRACLHAYMRV